MRKLFKKLIVPSMVRSNRGQTMLEVVIVGSIAAIIALSLSKLFTSGLKSKQSLEADVELIGLKQNLIANLSCSDTLTPSVMAACSSSTYIDLKNRAGTVITAPRVTAGTSIFNGAGRSGNYYLRAYCDTANTTIVVQVAKPGLNDNSYANDPASQLPLDFTNKKMNPLYGPTTGPTPHNIPLCQASFGGASVACGGGNYISNIDFVHQTFTCSANANVGDCTGTPNGVVKSINWSTQTVTCQAAATGSCTTSGDYVTGYDPTTGAPICSNPIALQGPPLSATCSAGYYINSVDFASRSWTCSTTANSNLCSPPNQVVTNVNFTTGGVSCGNLATSYNCPSGYYSVGTNTSNQAICQPLPATTPTVAGDCSAVNKVVGAIRADGTVVCINPLVGAATPVCPSGQFSYGNAPDGSPFCVGPAGNFAFTYKENYTFNFLADPISPSTPVPECANLADPGTPNPGTGTIRAQYTAVATCDPGYVVVGGSLDCQDTQPGGAMLATVMGFGNYAGFCCVYTTGTKNAQGKITSAVPVVTEHVIAACLRQN